MVVQREGRVNRMKQNKRLVAFLLCVAVGFHFVSILRLPEAFYQHSFFVGLSRNYDFSVQVMGLYWLFILGPLAFMLFYESGSMEDILYGYGKLMIIRRYSKTKLLLRVEGKLLLETLVFVAVQGGLSLLLGGKLEPVEQGLFPALAVFFLMTFLLLQLQLYLEFFFPSNVVTLGILAYLFSSCYMAQGLQLWQRAPGALFLLFPALLYGEQNGATHGEAIFPAALVFAVVANGILFFASKRRFSKIDIF